MERIKKKIHSQSGASFLLALLAFLVAAVVSVVIVTAAVTNVKRIYSDREAQQDHLTLLSAAQLVRDEMEKTRYIITTTTTTTTTTGENGEEITETTTTVDKSAEGTFAAEIKDAVGYVDQCPKPFSTAFIVKVDGLDDMKPVKDSFVMKAEEEEKYYLVFTLSIDETGEADETLFLKMTSPGIEYSDTAENGNQTIKTEEIKWKNGIISAVGDTAGGTNEQEAQK